MSAYPVVVAGAAAYVPGRLMGWRRWTLLGRGIYQTTLILIPLLGAPLGRLSGRQLCWVVVEALPSSRSPPRPPRLSGSERSAD